MEKPFAVWQDVYLVGGADISDPSDCLVYVVDGGDALALIDSGCGQGFERLVQNIEAVGLEPQKLRTVVATHRHIDHVGGLHDFRETFGARVVAHEADARAIESGRGVGAEFYQVAYKPCIVDIKLARPEEALECGRHTLNLVHIPGHTPGGIAAYLDVGGKRVLFGQDVHGPYVPEWGADVAQARLSLQRLLDLDADILCEGHFGIFEPREKVIAYIEGYLRDLECGP